MGATEYHVIEIENSAGIYIHRIVRMLRIFNIIRVISSDFPFDL